MKVIILLLLVALVFSDTCGGNCPGGKCPNCPCGTARNILDINAWCAKYNWNQACCKCIVSHESSGNSNSMNYNTNNTFDVGLWQINHVCYSLFRSTGLDAVEVMPPAIPLKTSTVPSRSTTEEETGVHGALIPPAVVDYYLQSSIKYLDIFLTLSIENTFF